MDTKLPFSVVVTLLILNNSAGYSQNSFQTLLGGPRMTISGDMDLRKKHQKTPKLENDFFIENKHKKKKYQRPLVRIFNPDNCPTFGTYYSKEKEKRKRLLKKKGNK